MMTFNKGLLVAISLLVSLAVQAQDNSVFVHKITPEGIPHRDYEGNIIVSSYEKIAMLLNNDVVGYYEIPVKEKTSYLKKLQKERTFLLKDEYQIAFQYESSYRYAGLHDIYNFKYDEGFKCYLFSLNHFFDERYNLSNEKGSFHLLVSQDGIKYCLTYPKSLVSVENRRDDGKVMQFQIVYTSKYPELKDIGHAFATGAINLLLWQFKIEKVNVGKKRLYGKSTGLRLLDSDGSVLVNLDETLRKTGTSFYDINWRGETNSTNTPKWHVCTSCNGKGWGTGLNDSRRRTCPGCGGKGKVYF